MESNPVLSANLSADSGIPLYYQLVGVVKRCMSAGLLKTGDMLPSEAELCKAYNISRSTVRQAFGALEDEGLVIRQRGRGTFVAEPKLHRRNENIYSFTAEATAMGLMPSSTLLEFDVLKPDSDISKMLELHSEDVPVYRFTRIRKVNGVPLMLETSYYPQYIYPKLTRELLEKHSFYSLLYDVGIMPASARDSYEAIKLDHSEAEILQCKPGSAGFFHQRVTRTENGQVFEFTQSIIRGDKVKLDVFMQKDGFSFARSFDRE